MPKMTKEQMKIVERLEKGEGRVITFEEFMQQVEKIKEENKKAKKAKKAKKPKK